MNVNQLVNMFTKIVARRAMNWGINKGMKGLSRKGGAQSGNVQQPGQQADLKKRMRSLRRMTRR
ncbi:hypothetical protein Q4511_12475 [Paracoccus sp. 1_MG-2023]|uniref:hypothetical protein n=1 Tax=unclassified Paracoccus (in: a-proteobacteria) TaxID=2688777 RepID=UPI001C098F73|nr:MULTISPECIES: hypothetical protein [unclassified Paracoccus (in: a-proteobacteria)]MBU2956458.1 hypothetical protein [Paracoccus sp. C2R09]MDO6669738.1 hypothetical protein [Paracoccus sp. 1_MG-2023]